MRDSESQKKTSPKSNNARWHYVSSPKPSFQRLWTRTTMATTLPSSSVLASSIPLPHDPHICYALFHPSHATQDATQCIELGRRHILSLNSTSGSGAPLAEPWLSSTHISSSPYIYVFRVATSNEQDSAVASLKGLSLDGLNGKRVPYRNPNPTDIHLIY